jgi:hypothetical protein
MCVTEVYLASERTKPVAAFLKDDADKAQEEINAW